MSNEGLPQDFFFNRSNDASILGANKEFYQDFAAGQVPGVNSLGGQGSCNWGPGSWINQANAGVLPPPGNIGHVPSHVSVGSNRTQATSVVTTSRYFGSTCRTPTGINTRCVICPKTACGAHGSCDYSRHQDAVTCALPHICTSMRRTQRAMHQISTQIFSPKMPATLQRSRTSSNTWTQGTCLIYLSSCS